MNVDRLVVARGAASALLVAAPAALANAVLADQEQRSQVLINLTYLAVLGSFVLAGFVAGLEAPGDPRRHGIYAALAAFVAVEIIGILGRLDRGAPISLLGIAIVGLFAVLGGNAGSRLATHRRKVL